MLFTIEDDDVYSKYLNLNNDSKNVLKPKEGLIIGNLFIDSYVPYKDYKPKEIITNNSKEKELLKIQELSFAINDLQLFLDLEPKNAEMYYIFKNYVSELKKCVKIYSEKYGPLEVCDDLGGEYSWYKNPWTWEVEANV